MSLNGTPNKEIAESFNVSTKTVTALLSNHETTLTTIEKNFFTFATLRENQKITEIKDKYRKLVDHALDIAIESENPVQAVKDLQPTIADMDKTYRLNTGASTDNKETKSTTVQVDIAKVLAELKTPEEKKAFLLSRINTNQAQE